MYIRHSGKYQKNIKIIHPGEYYASDEDELIGTLLGSCIAVCLYDNHNRISGMNHFMLPGRITSSDIFEDKSARYGITAINRLIQVVIKKGGVKSNFIAKVFGGGRVLQTDTSSNTIPSDNIKLARTMLEMEDIHIVQSDVGGKFTRKLLMDVQTGLVYLKKTSKEEVLSTVRQRDLEFAKVGFK